MRRAQTVLGPLALGGAWIAAEHVILGKGWPPLWLMAGTVIVVAVLVLLVLATDTPVPQATDPIPSKPPLIPQKAALKAGRWAVGAIILTGFSLGPEFPTTRELIAAGYFVVTVFGYTYWRARFPVRPESGQPVRDEPVR